MGAQTVRWGRFAPSPTGPLHAGSLATALASWLDARAKGYGWLVRIEDLDPPREAPGAADLILRQLLAHGLSWQPFNKPPARKNGLLYQSDRHEAYQAALNQLIEKGRAYVCTCSRKTLQQAFDAGLAKKNEDGEILYPGFCRQHSLAPSASSAWRFRSEDGADDFILKRADGFWAYHLAAVVDDAFQGITDIVRGSDLAVVAERHRMLERALGLASPRLIHVPVCRNAAGEKLSKQTGAAALCVSPAAVVSAQREAAWRHLKETMSKDWLEDVSAAYVALKAGLK